MPTGILCDRYLSSTTSYVLSFKNRILIPDVDMLKTVKIENFRGFKSFELQQLGRVNLLVGINNSGKTSLLEALQLLYARNDLESFANSMIKRGEFVWSERHTRTRELEICHLFHGHEIEESSQLTISGFENGIFKELKISIESGLFDRNDNEFIDIGILTKELGLSTKSGFFAQWTTPEGESSRFGFPLSVEGNLLVEYVHPIRRNPRKPSIKSQFISSSSLTVQEMTELFEEVVLTPEENLVYEALQTIEPNIKRIASVAGSTFSNSPNSHGGFVVRLADSVQRVPIGSLGDGVWRMLGIALAIVSARGGVLLIDEIDTGLHFSVMSDMWRLIWETAKKLDVQVFATTHNSDCWKSLAAIAKREDAKEEGISIQRIEADKTVGIAFTEREIVVAAERGIEVR